MTLLKDKTTAYATRGLPPAPSVSMKTIPMAGLLVDAYGLEELKPEVPVTCLWLLHPRTRNRARMSDIACRVVQSYNESSSSSAQGLIALAFDMPNHGTRLVSELGNKAWKDGNSKHALDMMGMVRGGKGDMSALMDVVGGYLTRDIGGHVVLGWSLGGHAAWEAWIGEPRVKAGVVVVGCPDFMGLMGDRAKRSDLDCGENFLGSQYFPRDLILVCEAHDPKGILFGTAALPSLPLSPEEKTRLRETLQSRGCLQGKKLLLCSGADDRLVPHRNSKRMVQILKELEIDVDDRVYEGVGHAFSADMVQDAVAFLVQAVADGAQQNSRL
ncbi:Alpha/Beta hydrolase protein [Emericellopsis atlantica]|uniref:Alpha/Beta hydrolase protein n=1 Tax=Emericellopsis atlantica TaxID=2614577 RepID=A0A9P7ZQ31_9HYPO|nr:Alpha/Beta hydrolase protein [Emericellopsis atlantica]KAG9255722.1 Alpha/Beta hydrolase protein [Emericellopsis atlantica]